MHCSLSCIVINCILLYQRTTIVYSNTMQYNTLQWSIMQYRKAYISELHAVQCWLSATLACLKGSKRALARKLGKGEGVSQ